jgi:hypothetical protein
MSEDIPRCYAARCPIFGSGQAWHPMPSFVDIQPHAIAVSAQGEIGHADTP